MMWDGVTGEKIWWGHAVTGESLGVWGGGRWCWNQDLCQSKNEKITSGGYKKYT